jgi:hypothetical protein
MKLQELKSIIREEVRGALKEFESGSDYSGVPRKAQITSDFQRVVIGTTDAVVQDFLKQLEKKDVTIKGKFQKLIDPKADKIIINTAGNKIVIDIKRENAATLAQKIKDELSRYTKDVKVKKNIPLKKA